MDVDVIIIGTGFGATVAATRLLEKKPNATIHLMERGVWWFTPERSQPPLLTNNPGKYPVQYWPRPDHSRGVVDLLAVVKTNNDFIEGIRNIADTVSNIFTGQKERPSPLYRYNLFKDIHIVTASGVGGGSLIYSNVTIQPRFDPATNRHPIMDNWPLQLSDADYKGPGGAREWMENKRGFLHKVVTKFPFPKELNLDPDNLDADHQFLLLGKSRVLRDVSTVSKATWGPVDNWKALELQVLDYDTVDDRKSQAADPKNETYCERQGRCILGCLPGARHTLNKTLINHALLNHPNVSLENLANVSHVGLRADGRYEVFYKNAQGQNTSHTARFVIVAAGTLGSTEILLRSQAQSTLKLSPFLGKRFSTNGDFAGFVTNVQKNLPASDPRYNIFPNRGPINTSHVMFMTKDGKVQINIEDGAVPSMLASLTGSALKVLESNQSKFSFMNQLSGAWFTQKLPDFQEWFPVTPDPSNPERFQTESEMLAHTFFFNTMGQDDATGVFLLNGEKLDLKFTDTPASQRVYQVTEEIMKAMAEKMGGTYVPFPTWQGFQTHKLITVHPLGGCVMGNGPADGVVNTKGQLFRVDQSGKTVYDGLFVMDGSIVPGPVAVNPTMTIVAFALKIVAGIPI